MVCCELGRHDPGDSPDGTQVSRARAARVTLRPPAKRVCECEHMNVRVSVTAYGSDGRSVVVIHVCSFKCLKIDASFIVGRTIGLRSFHTVVDDSSSNLSLHARAAVAKRSGSSQTHLTKTLGACEPTSDTTSGSPN